MAPTAAVRTLVAVLMGIGVVGGLDAARSGAWDLVAIFGAIVVGLAVLLARTSRHRPLVPMRADLVRWMARRAAVGGETTSAVADRAVAAYRAGLTDGDEVAHGRRAP
jgi:hypothetical protein